MKNLLLINSANDKADAIVKLVKRLKTDGYAVQLWSAPSELASRFAESYWPLRSAGFGQKMPLRLFCWLRYFYALKYFFRLAMVKYRHQTDKIICLSWPEKIIITPLAKFFKLPMIWLEAPNSDYQKFKPGLAKLYGKSSRWATAVVFTNQTQDELINFGCQFQSINLVWPGIEIDDFIYQESIFNSLAQKKDIKHTAFTVGAILDLNEQQRVEILLQAVKTCLIIQPQLQLVVIGDGIERKKIVWLVKKMGLEAHVWLVGEQAQLKKWLNDFDLFIVASQLPSLHDLLITLGAMANGLPVIGPQNYSLADLILPGKTGELIAMDDSETIAQTILRLEQDPETRKRYGRHAKAVVDKFFLFDEMVGSFKKILES